MAVNSKQKGNTFERKIANLLSERFAKVTGVDKAFTRNTDSGSFFGGKNVQRTQTHCLDYATFGDLVCPKNFKFTIECKNYAEAPSLDLIIKQNVKQWDGWISQSESDAKSANKNGLLIVKYKHSIEMVLVKRGLCSLHPAISYKDHDAFTLESLLSLPDEYFFE